MTRRMRIAAVACLTMAMPACITVPNDQTMRPWPYGPMGHRPLPGVQTPTQEQPSGEQFAEGRREPPPAKAAPPILLPHPEPPQPEPAKPVETIGFTSPRVEPSKVVLPPLKGESTKPAIELVPDKDGVIRAEWPTIPTTKDTKPIGESLPPVKTVPLVETPSTSGPVLPPVDSGPVIAAPPPVLPPAKLLPEPLPMGVLGTPNHQTRSSPVAGEPITNELRMASERESTAVAQNDSILIKAIRALQDNRPAEAAETFRHHDQATQQVLLALLPPLLQLAEGKLMSMKPEEIDVLLEQVTRVPNMLRTRASLHLNKVQLCREVHSFAKIEPYPTRHPFRPGDMVHLYVELANFSCPPEAKGGYAIALSSSLEIRDAVGNVVWRADPKEEPDRVSSAPLDYYRAYRFSVPSLAGGTYSLGIRIVDRPTGREVRKNIELRVAAK